MCANCASVAAAAIVTDTIDQDPLPIAKAIEQLTAEAVEARRALKLASKDADFAQRVELPIPPADIALAIATRTHRDSFVDAYIRWQLTSYDPPLPEFDDRRFIAFMRDAPSMVENPRGDQATMTLFERASEASRLATRDIARLRGSSNELDRRTRIAEQLNLPAQSYYQWVQDRLGDSGPAPRHWLLVRCNVTINAAWSTRAIKTAITRNFGQCGGDTTLTIQHRSLLAEQADRLAGHKRRFINEITFLADGSVNTTYSTAGVAADDVEKWTDRLMTVDEPTRTQLVRFETIGQDSTSPAPRPPSAVLASALRNLIGEATQSRADGALVRSAPNVAASVSEPLPAELIASKIIRPVDRDPLVDAYVRWQLTSFGPTLAPMSDREFNRFVATLPDIEPNPRADPAVLAEFDRIRDAGVLTEPMQERVAQRLDELERRLSTARRLRRPGEELRKWALKQASADGERRLRLQLEHLAARIGAGWGADDLKRQIEQAFERLARDPGFDQADRREIAQVVRQLIGHHCMFVGSARIEGGALIVEYDVAAVYDFDVSRWLRPLSED